MRDIQEIPVKFILWRKSVPLEHLNLGQAADKIMSVHSVYLIDLAEITYCCSITPSVFARELYCYPEWKEEFQDVLNDYEHPDYQLLSNIESELLTGERYSGYYDYRDIEKLYVEGGPNIRDILLDREDIDLALEQDDPHDFLVTMLDDHFTSNWHL